MEVAKWCKNDLTELERDAEMIENFLRSKGLSVIVNRVPLASDEGRKLVGRIKISIRGAENCLEQNQLKAIANVENKEENSVVAEKRNQLEEQKLNYDLGKSTRALKSSAFHSSSSSQLKSSTVKTHVVKTRVIKTTRTVKTVKSG